MLSLVKTVKRQPGNLQSDMDNQFGPMKWHAILKKDVELLGAKYRAGTMVKLQKDVKGNTHIVGYRSAVVQDDEWEMFWNQPAYEDLLNDKDRDV